jgi:hypothetical protein
VCDLSIEIVKPEKILPGVTTVQQNPIIKNYLTRLNAFKTIQFGNFEDIKKKGQKRNDSTTALAAAAKKIRKLDVSDDDIPVPQQDITLCDSELAATNKKVTKKLAHASPTTSPIKTEMYSPLIAKSSPKKIDIEDTNEDAKPSAKKKDIIAVDQMLAYLPLLQNLAVMMNDGNSRANLAFLMKAQEDSANINSD